MSRQPENVTLDFYVVVEPKWSEWWKDGEGDYILEGARLAKATNKRPIVTNGGVVVKLRFKIEAGALLPLKPQVVVNVNAGNSEVVEVDAIDPRDEET